MLFRLAADSTLLLHLAFIVFVLLGGLFALWRRWVPFVHIPAATWGFLVEVVGSICPLTYLENYFRIKSGQSGYEGGFIEHYFLNIIYPAGLTRDMQFALAGAVVLINIIVYGWLFWHHSSSDDV
ncbi:MAG TPA: DUF2784 domain-containing protein [Methylophilaceae bacterium]|nr:DUF2784 domain-containing protein [Methylophilaceae bacterium]